MAARGPFVTIPIAELVDVCTSMQARCDELFTTLGRWVADTDDPAVQQRFARAGHRHAWHAELWAQRLPVIPAASAASAEAPTSSGEQPDTASADTRLAWYLDTIAQMRDELDELSARGDSLLDPSTERVILLVTADLAAELT